MLKSHACGELRRHHVGQEVTLAGWVHRRRDHGGLIFIDLRDHEGIVQVVFHPQEGPEAFPVGDAARQEYVLQVQGVVSPRPPGTENPRLPTGEIEVRARRATILNPSRTPPFYVNEETEVEELLRLKYRYLDLRRQGLHQRIVFRHKVSQFIRRFLSDRGFIEIETPILTVPTPEGARDYLVPSRLHPGRFYALPQSPQQHKQILMVAGFERYFQLARCFRDEDLRADRQPEFTQLDLEWSFAEEGDILSLMEELMCSLVAAFRPELKVARPFPRIPYDEALRRFGTDKPDIRYGLELVDFSDLLQECQFAIFRQVLAQGGQVRGLCLPQGAGLSRKQVDDLARLVQGLGARGLVTFAILGEAEALGPDDFRSPVAKHFRPQEVAAMARRAGARPGDMLLLVADTPQVVNRSLDGLRRHLAHTHGLADPQTLAFCFIVDFPLLEWDEEDGRWYAVHHPFTSPKEEDIPLLRSDPGRARARSYDLVCNGWELGGGSIRIHKRELQEEMFRLLGIGPEEAWARFGHLLEALDYGAPPHGGIALGLDRLVALLCGQDDIREVIAFPKTKSATDPLTGAPAPVTPAQLEELHICVRQEQEVS
mgnify:CR=1 FL=1